jgi:magnesium transporter
MKVLTVLSTVALPALVVSGFYGMNVKGLPGADSPYGSGISIVVMATILNEKWFIVINYPFCADLSQRSGLQTCG